MYMEVYVPYAIGSSVTAFLGKVAYSYLYPEPKKVVVEEVEKKEDIEYNLVDSNLNERHVNSDKDKRSLGASFNEKIEVLEQSVIQKMENHQLQLKGMFQGEK